MRFLKFGREIAHQIVVFCVFAGKHPRSFRTWDDEASLGRIPDSPLNRNAFATVVYDDNPSSFRQSQIDDKKRKKDGDSDDNWPRIRKGVFLRSLRRGQFQFVFAASCNGERSKREGGILPFT